MMKLIVLIFICFAHISCNGQKTSNEDRLATEWKKAEYYASKYSSPIKAFRKLIFEQYFKNMDVRLLRTTGECQRTDPIFYPVNFEVRIDTLLSNNISFSEKIMFVSLVFFRKKMPETIGWSSDMEHYCNSEMHFIKTNIDEKSINGDYQIGNGFSVGLIRSKQDSSEIIYLGTDASLNDYPILLKIYLKKEADSQ